MQYKKTTAIKCFATFLVICCHCCHLDIYNNTYCQYSVLVSRILLNFGTLGVAVFFLISGYNFGKTSKNTINSFFLSRLVNLVVPWFFTASIVYLYTAVRKNGIKVSSMVLEIIGIGNYTWYLTSLFLLFFLFWWFRKDEKGVLLLTILCIIVSPFQNLVIPASSLGQFVYIFQFTWIALFGLGLIVSQKEVPFFEKNRTTRYILLGSTTAIVIFLSVEDIQIYYWSFYYPIIAIPFTWGLFAGNESSIEYACIDCPLYIFICKALLPIYLLHMPIAGIVARVFNKLYYSPVIIRPIMTEMLTLLMLWIAKTVSEKMHFSKVFCLLTGFRGR